MSVYQFASVQEGFPSPKQAVLHINLLHHSFSLKCSIPETLQIVYFVKKKNAATVIPGAVFN